MTGPRVPCHNDLLTANFLDDGGRLRLLDWEYAGMNDPLLRPRRTSPPTTTSGPARRPRWPPRTAASASPGCG